MNALFHLKPLPNNHEEAMDWLMQLVHASETGTLTGVNLPAFRRGWFAVGFLYSGLHPDSLNHGTELTWLLGEPSENAVPDQRLLFPYYSESGWPQVLVPILNEAWRRYVAAELGDSEFYCAEAIMAGMVFRNPALLANLRVIRSE